ncbi:DUF2922 domain-containing protein [Sporomusa termitida]|uniref:DUF2922 domain-containing protein n=1 Tax=Sporomusa termitida TaxID=2377 RepID=A0A517DX90_9FIRM|nr:DUF2922 domain-containing protein [Sporomusa termitida]QDR81975.1 hypothetical protein SPTER_33960 [Sporomusa termitida]
MIKTLEMVFRTSAGKEVSLSVPDPKEGLTLAEAQVIMEDIAARNIFSIKGAALAAPVEARIRSRETVLLV